MKTLWLGLDAPETAFHYPMIKIEVLDVKIPKQKFTHVIFTSKTTVDLLQDLPKDLVVLAVGKKTAERAVQFQTVHTATDECAEGVIQLLEKIDPKKASIFYPHSKKARGVIREYLEKRGFDFVSIYLYDVSFQAPKPIPNLNDFEKLVFTSPSCVDAFFFYFKYIPEHLSIECIGSITHHHLTKKFQWV